MSRHTEPSGVHAYYKALQRILKLQSHILTGAIPHRGERGKNDELRLRDFLQRVLPRRFSVGSGFLVCSDPPSKAGPQTDLIIYDNLHNSPLCPEIASEVYPIEMVYATIEVKGSLDKGKEQLQKALEDVAAIRSLAQKKYYVEYNSVPRRPDVPDQRVVQPSEHGVSLPPRSFLFAYEGRSLGTIDDFRDALEAALTEHKDAHLHGVVVLDQDWFLAQEAFSEPPTVQAHRENALLRFVSRLIHTMASMPMAPASIDRYMLPSG